MRRYRQAKIVATVGPASDSEERLRALFEAGADVFRLNFSHGTHEDHRQRYARIRAIEQALIRPIGVLMDLQGPKLRVGTMAAGPVQLVAGQRLRLELQGPPGDARRVTLPHPEVFSVMHEGMELLIDDGRLRLRVAEHGADYAETTVLTGGPLSDRKGVNVPGVVLPMSALTPKDREDLAFGLELGVDWVALSFVQRAEDIAEIKGLVGGRAGVVAKLEKPAAIGDLEAIVEAADAVMVARGDLGVEMPAEQVPSIQKRILRSCRRAGKPVIVATQMLDSMVSAPTPTRAEASDVANAIYDGADAVMLSAESASGSYPLEAVQMMNRIIVQTESDVHYRELVDASQMPPHADLAGAIGLALRHVVSLLHVAATVAYTSSGYSALCMSRERPESPILGLTPSPGVARRLALAWGVHPLVSPLVGSVGDMTEQALAAVRDEGFAHAGQIVAIVSGLPLAVSGTTNMLRLAQV